VFPVRCEHHLHVKGQSYPYNRPWSPIGLWNVEDPTLSGPVTFYPGYAYPGGTLRHQMGYVKLRTKRILLMREK
jgi:hypothetical protein